MHPDPTRRDALALDLIPHIYRAAMDPSHWHRFAAGLSEAVGGAAVTLAIRRPETRRGWDYFGAGSHDLAIRVAEDLQGALKLAARRVEGLRRGFVDLGEAFPGIALESDPWFGQWMDPLEVAPVWPLCHAVTVDGVILCWILVQPTPHFDREHACAVGARLVPHLERALRSHREIGARSHKQRALEEVLDRLPTGIVQIDADQRVMRTNVSAQRMLALDDGIALSGSRIRARRESDAEVQAAIASAIEAAARGDLDHVSRVSVPTRSGRRPFLLAVMPLLQGVAGSRIHDAVALAFLSNPDAISTASVQALEAVYGLTAAEAGIVQGLVQGLGLEEIAERRGVKLETTRSQLKQVFAKTRTTRQAELIRLVLAGVSPLSEPSSGPEREESP